MIAFAVSVMAALIAVVVPNAPVARADESLKGGDFVPLSSAALVDTRDGIGVRKGTIGADQTLPFQVTARLGIPSVTNVRAVALRVAIIDPSTETAITLFPSKTSRPGIYHAFSSKDASISNGALVEVGTDGKISMRNRSGTTHVAIYVRGYFTKTTSNPGKGGLIPTDHTVVLDSWTGDGNAVPIAAGGQTTKRLTGGVLPAGTRAAYGDLTVSSPNQGYLTMATNEDPTLRPAIGFSAGATQTGLAVPISADGTVKIHNSGPSPVNYRMTVHGYFSAGYNVGAGFVPATGRLYGSATLGPNSEITIIIKGKYGVPGHGVSAYSVNLNATGASGPGRFRIKPCASGNYAGYAGRFDNGMSRSTQSIVKADCGRVVIRNDSAESVVLSVDLQGWFATKMPNLSVQPHARPTAIEVSPGMLRHAYIDHIGALRFGKQTSPGNYVDIQWTTMSDSMAFTGQPSLSRPVSTTPTVRVAALNLDNDVWTRDEIAAEPPWASWVDYRAPMKSSPVFGTEPNGTQVLFAVSPDGELWARPMSGDKAYWAQLVTTTGLNQPEVITVADGIRVFVTDSSGTLRTGLYGGGVMTPGTWITIGTGMTATPSLIKYPGNRLRVFARQADGRVVTTLQAPDGTFSAGWTPVGDQVISGSPSAVLDPDSGRAEVVALADGGDIRSTGETAQGSGVWRAWTTATPGSTSEPTAIPLTDSQYSWAIVHRDVNNIPKIVTAETKQAGMRNTGGAPASAPPEFSTAR